MTYRAPVRDLEFAMNEVVGVGQLFGTETFPDFDQDTLSAVLEAAGVFAAEVLAPLNRTGDIAGSTFQNGVVTTPPGFAEAMRQFGEGGWNGLTADPAFGGQGLPKALEVAVFEMVHAANMAFGLCPTLTQAAIAALQAHGDERQQRLYLPPLISGRWTGTMNLTEAQAGSDLAALRTRAEPDGAGGWRLFGEKVFITWGEHDCAENIVHMVLARIDRAPEGIRGISLFVSPRRLVGEDGGLGEANGIRAGGVEHKLGINASPTCVMLYEGARAELVGQENQGLAHMFTMMNAARLAVGAQGVGIAERAYQQALAYALERRQGRSAWTGEAGAPIFDHPDIRRMLADMKARIEAARALCLLTAVNADLAQAAPFEEARAAARLREEVLTPIAKAWSTDIGVEVASLGVQIHGGAGYIEETGAAQHYRDARIAPIYEGTNGIQAIDLVGRKLGLEDGEGARALLAEVRAGAAALIDHYDGRLAPIGLRLDAAGEAAQAATDWMVEHRGQPDALAGAVAYTTMMGETLGGWLLGKAALVAADGRGEDQGFRNARITLAAHFAETVLAQTVGRTATVSAGAAILQSLDAAALGAVG